MQELRETDEDISLSLSLRTNEKKDDDFNALRTTGKQKYSTRRIVQEVREISAFLLLGSRKLVKELRHTHPTLMIVQEQRPLY